MANRIVSPHRRFVGARPSRATVWLGFIPARVALTAAGGTVIFTLNAAALALRPFTVVRTRFALFIDSDQSAAAEQQVAGFGVAVVSEEAAAAGVASVPTPITEIPSDLWFVHRVLYSAQSASDAGGRGGNAGTDYIVDSKAMRKVSIGQDIVVVGEFSAVGGGLRLTVGGRMLVKTL